MVQPMNRNICIMIVKKQNHSYGDFVELEFKKAQYHLEDMARKTEEDKVKMSPDIRSKMDILSLQRKRFHFKNERALAALKLEKKNVTIAREKVKLQLDEVMLQKAELEVVQLQQIVNLHEVMSPDRV